MSKTLCFLFFTMRLSCTKVLCAVVLTNVTFYLYVAFTSLSGVMYEFGLCKSVLLGDNIKAVCRL